MERIDHTYIFPEKPEATRSQKQKASHCCEAFIFMVPRRGIEPPTRGFSIQQLYRQLCLPSIPSAQQSLL